MIQRLSVIFFLMVTAFSSFAKSDIRQSVKYDPYFPRIEAPDYTKLLPAFLDIKTDSRFDGQETYYVRDIKSGIVHGARFYLDQYKKALKVYRGEILKDEDGGSGLGMVGCSVGILMATMTAGMATPASLLICGVSVGSEALSIARNKNELDGIIAGRVPDLYELSDTQLHNLVNDRAFSLSLMTSGQCAKYNKFVDPYLSQLVDNFTKDFKKNTPYIYMEDLRSELCSIIQEAAENDYFGDSVEGMKKAFSFKDILAFAGKQLHKRIKSR